MKKITNIILSVFSIGVMCTLFAGGLAFVGFIVAMCIGGETATEMSLFIYKTYFPWVIKATSVFAGLGLIGMYLSKQRALSAKSEKKDKADTQNP